MHFIRPPLARAFRSSPSFFSICLSPQVIETLGHQDTKTLERRDTGTMVHQDNGWDSVPTYRNHVVIIDILGALGSCLTQQKM